MTFGQFLTSGNKVSEEETQAASCLQSSLGFGWEGRWRGARTCHEEQEASHVLGQAFLPEETDHGHNAATEQHSHRHAQEARSDSSQI